MDVFLQAYDYAVAHRGELWAALEQHLLLVGVAPVVAALVCLPLGVLTSRSRAAAAALINGVNALRVVPSLAILFLAIPYFGLATKSSLIALTVLALPP